MARASNKCRALRLEAFDTHEVKVDIDGTEGSLAGTINSSRFSTSPDTWRSRAH